MTTKMTFEEFKELPGNKYDNVADETAQRAVECMSLEDLMNEIKEDLYKLYKQDPEILFRDACIHTVIKDAEEA